MHLPPELFDDYDAEVERRARAAAEKSYGRPFDRRKITDRAWEQLKARERELMDREMSDLLNGR